jgi:hypothetical protein
MKGRRTNRTRESDESPPINNRRTPLAAAASPWIGLPSLTVTFSVMLVEIVFCL